jgi:hypothetical protein
VIKQRLCQLRIAVLFQLVTRILPLRIAAARQTLAGQNREGGKGVGEGLPAMR